MIARLQKFIGIRLHVCSALTQVSSKSNFGLIVFYVYLFYSPCRLQLTASYRNRLNIFFTQRLVTVKFPPPCHCQVPSALSLSSSLRLVNVKFPPPCNCQVPSALSLSSSLRLVTGKFPPNLLSSDFDSIHFF